MHPIRIGIPLVMITLFLIYIVYMVISKKDPKSIKKTLYPGLFFIGVWAVIYFVILK